MWLKHVPAFFAHEGALLCFVRDRLGRADVPRLLAHDSGRLLLDDVPVTDRYEADLDERKAMVRQLVELQHVCATHVDALLGLGLPDWRANALTSSIQRLVEQRSARLSGNVRGDRRTATILDWGDSGVAHPMLDQPAFLRVAAPEEVGELTAEWSTAWRRALPACDPDRATVLLSPVAAARQALIYQGFLDRIAAAERPYHAGDVADWLTRCAALVASQ